LHPISYSSKNWLILELNNEEVRKRLPDIRGVVYDLGCGIRPYERDILSVADRYIGVDWSNTLHALRADIVADLNEPLPIEDQVADTVVSFQVLEHLREPCGMLSEAFRILRPGGRMVLSVPFQWQVHEAPHDYFRYTRYGLEYMLGKSGFIDVSVDEVCGFFGTWVLKLNYQTARMTNRASWPCKIGRTVLVPFWFLGQWLAPRLDRRWPNRDEAAGYYVTARRPA
jgi:SAM-dependent methyltransferase